jgi:hypothetical protein
MINQEFSVLTEPATGSEMNPDIRHEIPWGTEILAFDSGMGGRLGMTYIPELTTNVINHNLHRLTSYDPYALYNVEHDLVAIYKNENPKAILCRLQIPLVFHAGTCELKFDNWDAITNISIVSCNPLSSITFHATHRLPSTRQIPYIQDGHAHTVSGLSDTVYLAIVGCETTLSVKLIDQIDCIAQLHFDRVSMDTPDRRRAAQSLSFIHELRSTQMWSNGGELTVDNDVLCPISMFAIGDTIYKCHVCNVLVDYECLLHWININSSCPNCRSPINYTYYTKTQPSQV